MMNDETLLGGGRGGIHTEVSAVSILVSVGVFEYKCSLYVLALYIYLVQNNHKFRWQIIFG